MNLRIHELVIFNQTTEIDTHEEKYFHSIHFHNISQSLLLDFQGRLVCLVLLC
jgi:hypothetical protein